MILLDGIDTLQAVLVKNKEETSTHLSIEDYNVLRRIENESFIEVIGKIYCAEKAGLACSQQS